MATQHYKQLRVTGPGEPTEGALQMVDAEKPAQVGEHEVLLRMKAAPINPSDLISTRGRLWKYEGPAGDEGLGVVEQVGTGVTDLKVGQRVAFYTAGAQRGTWGQYFLLNTKVCPLYYVVPEQLSDEAACQIALNPLTLLGMLNEFNIKQGDWLLQTAAASALGRQLIQYAKLKGYKTINAVRRAEQIAELKALGADEVVLLDDNFVENVKKIAPNLKFAIDAVSGKTAGQVASTLTEGGLLLVYGLLSSAEIVLPFTSMLNDQSVKVYLIGKWKKNPEKAREVLREYVDFLVAGHIRHPAKTFSLENFIEAIKHSESGGKSEKSVLLL